MPSNADFKVTLNDGNVMPQFILGTPDSPPDYEAVPDVVKAFVRLGLRAIDTAWFYGAEPYVGKALKELFDAGEVKREELFITTKVWPALWDRAEFSLKKSLSDLGLDYVDLVFHHWPVCFDGTDENGLPKVPRDDKGRIPFAKDADWLTTYKDLLKLRDAGLAKSVGVSNYTIKHIKRAIDETGVVPAVLQVELHPRIPQLDLVKYAESQGIKVEAYSPLGHNGAPLLKEPLIQKLAEKYNVEPAFILYAYHVNRGRIVITKTTKVERVKTFGETIIPTLSSEDLDALDDLGIKNPKRFVQNDWGVGLGFEHWKEKFSWEEDQN
ncbi:CYFA0S20e00760g1_1 [Cyberlindnera fabianii]|uniref:CYFA0S20e00760g1_1 n=1 Tax=Cyberlindnera fabianii TaxID=36022 RepID=A0A061B7F2_CYBFA|nr:D-arabinose dehydrogenase [NAD(P)+] heavy chain [Cyberlindnera fabianii]CDR45838.1 CYFA0S20e00760g1_1 [Cyberlindnera fabianii]